MVRHPEWETDGVYEESGTSVWYGPHSLQYTDSGLNTSPGKKLFTLQPGEVITYIRSMFRTFFASSTTNPLLAIGDWTDGTPSIVYFQQLAGSPFLEVGSGLPTTDWFEFDPNISSETAPIFATAKQPVDLYAWVVDGDAWTDTTVPPVTGSDTLTAGHIDLYFEIQYPSAPHP